MLFVKLLLAHLIGDFLLQPYRWVVHKEAHKARSHYLYLHTIVHFVLILVVLWDMGQWKLALLIALSHYVIDLLKLYASPRFKNQAVPFFIDQGLHLLVLYIGAHWPHAWEGLVALFQQLDWPLVTAFVFVTFPSAIIMAKVLQGMADQISFDHKSLPNAGKYIGMMERIFVLLFIVLDRWEAIGLLITAKSVFRFNDLKESNNRKLTEYILIGTLLSFGLAILAGLAYVFSGG